MSLVLLRNSVQPQYFSRVPYKSSPNFMPVSPISSLFVSFANPLQTEASAVGSW
jgi:hypothetical protein